MATLSTVSLPTLCWSPPSDAPTAVQFCQVLYCLVRFVWHHESVTSWTVAGYVFLVATTYATYSWVVSAAEAGGSSE